MTDGFSLEEMKDLIARAKTVRGAEPAARDPLADLLCRVYPRLDSHLSAFRSYLDLSQKEDAHRRCAGYLLETIIALGFSGLEGVVGIKSYQSAGGQYDLVVNGGAGEPLWRIVREFLHMPDGRNDLIVEVKATEGRINDQQMLRFCGLIDAHFRDTVGLGVMICPQGATGYPTAARRVHSLKAARMHQVLFHARSGVAVVVLEESDIFAMLNPGGLLRSLDAKGRELRELRGTLPDIAAPVEVDVPPHMASVRRWVTAGRPNS